MEHNVVDSRCIIEEQHFSNMHSESQPFFYYYITRDGDGYNLNLGYLALHRQPACTLPRSDRKKAREAELT